MAIDMDIILADRRWADAVPAHVERLEEAADCLSALADVHGEAALMLADACKLHELNRQWRGKDRPTDVLSFEAGEAAKPYLGDVAIAFELAEKDAGDMGKALGDHLVHLVVHGLLHLAGHTHDGDEDAELMEGLEIRTLEKLGLPDPYLVRSGGERPAEQKNRDAI